MKKMFKAISVMLTVTMLFVSVPLKGAALGQESTKTQSEKEEKPEAKITGELVNRREKNVKHFLKDDMTFEAVLYPKAVHYRDENGKWKDIDNTLVEKKDEEGGTILCNRENDFGVSIAQSADSTRLVTINRGGYEISWGLKGAQAAAPGIKQADTGVLDKMSENSRRKALTNLSSTVEFEGVMPKVDMQYRIEPEGVKEYIILNQKTENSTFTFEMSTKGLEAELKKDNSVVFLDENDTSIQVFRMAAPFMTDAAGATSTDISVSLEEKKDGLLLKYIPDNTWLNEKDRAYPVKIDPWISSSDDPDDVKDTYISTNSSYNYGDRPILSAYKGSYEHRTFISFPLPQMETEDTVTGANLNI